MYVVKYGNQYIHDPFSDSQRAYDISISSDINASGTCEFTIGPSHPLYDELELRSSSSNVMVLEDDTVLFDGYIYSFNTNYDKSRDVTCYGCLSYLGDIRLRPYSTQKTDNDPPDMLYCSSTIDGLFEFYIDQYNKYADEGHKFLIGTNEGSVIRELNSIAASSDSYPTVSDELSEKLLNDVGGYVFIHHDGGTRYIDYFANCTDVNAQIIDFGVNIIDFVKTDTMSEFYTALRPVGGTPNEAEGESKKFPISLNLINDGHTDVTGILKKGDVVYDEDAVMKYGYIEGYKSYSEITDVEALQHQAAVDVQIASSIHPTIEVKAIDLALYKQGNKPLVPGQLVRVRSIPHGIDEYLLLNNMDIDISDPSQTVYTFGEAIDSLTGEQNKKAAELNASINHSLDAVAELDQTTKDQAIQIGKVEDVANDASDKADQAQDTADNAQNAADNAQQAADNAQQTADSNKEEIDQIKDQQSEQDKLIEQMQQGIEQAEQEIGGINDRLDQMDTEAGDVQASIDAVRQEAQTNFETAKAAADAAQAKADAVGADLESFRTETGESIQNVKDSVSGVRSDVDAVTQKAADLASELDGTKATVEQVTTDLGEVKTTVSNAATKADQALQVSTSASQTATEAKTTATSAYRDAQSALTQSSTASQTANAVKTELETKYSTTDEIAEQYATKSLVEQTSQSITSTVEATYATKATVEALENIANNAVQTWMGSGVPTLSNKPASDWTTAELKSQHSGDIYYDTDTGYSYRFGSSDGSNYSWSLIKDTDIAKAVADAAEAQQTAEGVSDEVTQLKTDIPATYATKTEVKQTTDKISATATAASQNASSALSKVSSLEVSVNGIETKVEENASAIGQNTKTISQVSQKADSLSSKIEQTNTDVRTANGTANSALSKASTVEQNLNSFKTSVSQTYETKTDASSKQSSLQQSVNNLRTEVSETYTTKDEFNNLQIGGTNLFVIGTSKDGVRVSSEGGEFPDTGYTMSDYISVQPNEKYILTAYVDGSGNASDDMVAIARYRSDKSWIDRPIIDTNSFKYGDSWTITTTSETAYVRLSFPTSGKDKFKFEQGSKATAWSPAPEDFDDKYTSKTEFKQTTDKISATATAASQNASSALSKVSSLEVSVNGIETKVEENASAIGQNTKTISQVSQKADSLSSKIEQTNTDVRTANGTANSALSKASTVEQNLNSFKTSVSQTYETKTDASSKQSSLQQSVNNLRTEVSETYTTKEEMKDYNKSVIFKTGSGYGKPGYFQIARIKPNSVYINYPIRISVTNRKSNTTDIEITYSSIPGTDPSIGSFTYKGDAVPYLYKEGTSSWVLYIAKAEAYDELYVIDYSNPRNIPFTWLSGFADTLPSGYKSATKLIGSEPETTYSTKSYVDQTSRTVSLGVVEEYKKGQHGSALATQSDITAAKDSITSTVSQTYATKNDVGVGNLIQNGDFSDGSSNWMTNGGTSKIVDGTYGKQLAFTQTGTNTNGINRICNTSYNHINGQAYEVSFYAKADKSSKWHFGPHRSSKAASVTLDTTLKQYTMQYQADSTLVLSIWTDNPTATIYLERVKLSIASGYYATKTEVKQTSDSLTVTISSAVSKAESAATAASNAQNTANNANTTANTAKNTANTANSNAQNAQNRVGNLETCIKMTSDGVRVGKISNGNFTGYSALVNSAGSFDILDSNSNTKAKFTSNGLSFYNPANGRESVRINASTNGGTNALQIGSLDSSGRMISAIRFADSVGYSGLDIGATVGTIKIHGTSVEFTTTTAGVVFDGGLNKIMNGDSVPIFESGIYTGNTSSLGTIMINTTGHRTVIADSVIVSICDAVDMPDTMARLLTPVVWSRETGKIQVRFRRLDTNSWVTDAQRVSVSWLAIYY